MFLRLFGVSINWRDKELDRFLYFKSLSTKFNEVIYSYKQPRLIKASSWGIQSVVCNNENLSV